MIDGKRVFGRAPERQRRSDTAEMDQLLGHKFKMMYGSEPPGTTRWSRQHPPPPPVPVEYMPNTCYVGLPVIGAPARKKTSLVVDMGYLTKYRRGRIKMYAPKSTRKMGSMDAVNFKFNSGVKGIYYPGHQTLVLAWLGIGDHRTRENVQRIMGWIENHYELNDLPREEITVPMLNLTIGADPEFEILDPYGAVIVPNRSLYPNYLSTPIGIDGGGNQLEMRPAAGTIAECINNLRELMKTVKHRITTAGNTHPVGGHIHVGYGFEYRPTQDLVWLLDQYLGAVTIEMSGTARGSYKHLGNIEAKPWGFEYRVPPAAIFETPRFAELAMTVAKRVCERYGEGREFFVRKYGVAEQEYVDYGILTRQEYSEWKGLLTNYPWNTRVHDCRGNWADSSDLAEPYERIKTADELAEEQRQRDALAARTRAAEIANERARQEERDARNLRQQQAPQPQRPQSTRPAQLDLRGLQFADDWDPMVINHFVTRIRLQTDENLQLFGLAVGRGNVTYGYNVGNCERLPDIGEGGAWSGRFGVPYNVRMGQVSVDLTDVHINMIIETARVRAEQNNSNNAEVPTEMSVEDVQQGIDSTVHAQYRTNVRIAGAAYQNGGNMAACIRILHGVRVQLCMTSVTDDYLRREILCAPYSVEPNRYDEGDCSPAERNYHVAFRNELILYRRGSVPLESAIANLHVVRRNLGLAAVSDEYLGALLRSTSSVETCVQASGPLNPNRFDMFRSLLTACKARYRTGEPLDVLVQELHAFRSEQGMVQRSAESLRRMICA